MLSLRIRAAAVVRYGVAAAAIFFYFHALVAEVPEAKRPQTRQAH